MRGMIMLASAIALAAACSRGPDDGQAAPVRLQPGLWETVDVMTAADFSDVPEQDAAEIRALLNQPATKRECITPDMAADPARTLRDGLAGGGPAATGAEGCRYAENIYSDGVIRVRATCGRARISIDGSFTATTVNVRIATGAESPAAAGAPPRVARLRATSTSRRIGDCPR